MDTVGAPHVGVLNGLFKISDPSASDYGWSRRGDAGVVTDAAELREGAAVNAGMSQTFLLPADARRLRITLLDATLAANLRNPGDAVEIALRDAAGNSVLGAIAGLGNTDACFNLQTGGTLWFSPEVYVEGATSGTASAPAWPTTLSIDISALAEGAQVTLSVDLIGFGGKQSSLRFDAVLLADSVAPALTFDLDPASDSAVKGDGLTNIQNVRLAGLTDPYQLVHLDLDGDGYDDGSVRADDTGAFTLSGARLASGANNVRMKATNEIGATETARNLRLDLTRPTGALKAPAPNAVTTLDRGYVDVQWTDTGLAGLDTASFGASDVTITGVTIDRFQSLGGGLVRYWYGDDGDKLAGGLYTVAQVAGQVADKAGNLNPARSESFTFVPDTTPPNAPNGLAISPDTGFSAADGITNIGAVTLTGAVDELNLLVHLFDETLNASLGDATVSGTGFSAVLNLADGAHRLRVTAQDEAGNSSVAAYLTVLVDRTAPAAATLLKITPDTGVSATDGVTKTGAVSFGGALGEAGLLVRLFDVTAGLDLGLATVTGSGFALDLLLGEGAHRLRATAEDLAGNVAAASFFDVLVDLTAPAAAQGLGITPDSGASATDGVTNATNVTLSGALGEGGLAVRIFDDTTGAFLGAATVPGAGFTFVATFAEGAHRLRAVADDAAGNASSASFFDLVIDTAAPAPAAALGITPDTGRSATDGVTKTGALRFGGAFGESGLTARVRDLTTGVDFGAATFTGSAFAIDLSLAAGAHNLEVTATDLAGNVSGAATFLVTVDLAAPTAATGLSITPDTGRSATDGITNATALTFKGRVAENALIVRVYDDSTNAFLGLATVTGTSFSFAGNFAEGGHRLRAVAQDVAGNDSADALYNVTVDTSAPAASAALAVTPDNGASSTDGVTNTGALQFKGALGETGLRVRVFDATTNTDLGLAAISGASFTKNLALAAGAHRLRATPEDAAGNAGVASFFDVVVDLTAPVAPAGLGITPDTGASATDGVTNAGTVTFGGALGEAGMQVRVRDLTTGADLGLATVSGTLFTLPLNLAAGLHNLEATGFDLAGNAGPTATFAVTVDPTAPVAATNLKISPDSGSSASDGITNTGVVTFSGAFGEAGLTAQVFDTTLNTLLGPATVTGTGFTFAANLAEGTHRLRVAGTDLAGNNSPDAFFTVVVDKTAPAAAVGLGITPDTGRSATDGVTNTGTLAFGGTLGEAGMFVAVRDLTTNVNLGNATVAGLGFTLNLNLGSGLHNLRALVTDAAGNVSAAATFLVTVDRTAPGAAAGLGITPDSGSSASDGVTNTGVVTFAGAFGEAGLTAQVFDTTLNTLLGPATVTGTGFTFAANLAEGTHRLRVVGTDLAGNNSPDAFFTVVVDKTAPAAAAGLRITPDTGRSATDGVTNQSVLNFLGTTGETGLAVNLFDLTANVSLGAATLTGTAFTAALNLSAGTHRIQTTLVDAAGNASPGAIFTVVVDRTAPVAAAGLGITPDTGVGAADGITRTGALAFSGTLGEVGADVNLLDTTTGANLGAATVAGATFTANLALAAGAHRLQVVVTDAAGNASAAAFFNVLVDVAAPVGTLVGPTPGAVVQTDSGYVDVLWTDAGGSLLNAASFGIADVTITSGGVAVTVDAVQIMGGGVVRYRYNLDGEKLAEGAASVRLNAGAVTDIAGNANLQTTHAFSMLAAPRVTGFGVGDGSHSMIVSFSASFSKNVVLLPGALLLVGPRGIAAQLAAYDAATFTATWRFDADGNGRFGDSLTDGLWTARLNCALIRDVAGNALRDTDANPADGLFTVVSFTRLFGDADGNGVINGTDYQQFHGASFLWAQRYYAPSVFDLNDDGRVLGDEVVYGWPGYRLSPNGGVAFQVTFFQVRPLSFGASMSTVTFGEMGFPTSWWWKRYLF
jgi:hypothetical protein